MSVTHVVVGGAAVLKARSGSSDYLYRGALVDSDAYTADSIDHGVSVGLLAEVPPQEDSGETEQPEPYEGVKVADLKVEIDTRNKDRADDDKIVPAEPGHRAELVAALVADDEKQS